MDGPLSLSIVDFRSAVVGLSYDHRSVANMLGQKKTGVPRVLLPMAPCVDGERARQLAITLLGAKDGGRHHHERALALTSLRRQI